MSKSNQSALSFLLLFVSTSLITDTTLVFGSTNVSDRIARRPDPLRKFKQYGGDYDFRNKHYWASVAFTGIHGYTVGGLWLLSGVGFGSYIVLRNMHGNTSTTVDQTTSSYLIVLVLIVLFSVFAMITSGVVIAANQKSFQRTKMIEGTILDAADETHETMGKVKTSLIQMQTLLQQYNSDISNILDSMARRLRQESLSVQSFVDKFKQTFDRALQIIYVVNLVVISINLAFLVAGLILLTLHHHPAILILIICFWILTTLSWIMTGIDFFFDTFINDTCSSLKSFNENPHNNSITDMLPCPKSDDTQKKLAQIGLFVHSVTAEINSKISDLRQIFESNEQSEDQLIPEICNPFGNAPNYTYSPEICKNNTIQVGDLPNVFSKFICFGGSTPKNCTLEGRFIPEGIYTVALAYTRSIQELIDVYPDLSILMECSSVKDAISDIVVRQCKPIELSTKVLSSSMLTFSIVMVVLVLSWCGKAIQDRGRCFRRCSIFHSQSR